MALAVLLVVVVAAGTTVFAVGPQRVTRLVVEAASPTPTVPRPTPTTQPAAAGTAQPTTTPKAAAVQRTLAKPLAAKALGSRFGGYVVDPTTGETLLDRNGATAAVPASTTKLATSVAALHALGPDTRFDTAVVRSGADVVLVGGGDPTLLSNGKQSASDYPKYARLATLVEETVRALGDSPGTVNVKVDDSLYTGPRTGPGWKPNYVPEGSVAPVSALAVDHGMKNPNSSPTRVADPALHAGKAFAARLAKKGVRVEGEVARTTVGDDATELAEVQSPTVSELVEETLENSDNDVAEALGRHVAIEAGEPASFDGARTGIRRALRDLGVGEGISLYDGSGLSTKNRITPRALTEVVSLVASGERPALSAVLSGLPVGGFSGTLSDRFSGARADDGVGVVRAKTGTLSQVSTLAGYVRDEHGQVLVFAFMAGGMSLQQSWKSPAALDRLAAALASCGCN